MDTGVLKGFATAARLQLLRDVGSRLDVVLDPASAERRESAGAVSRLEDALSVEGRQAVVDRVAYTWFNRIMALRFMDANGYNPVNVVSAAAGQSLGQPEVLADAKSGHVDTDVLGGAAGRVMDLLTGRVSSPDPQQEAYRLLLIGYCNQLHDPMPFMFEKIGDETELLMPADLLSDNSIINKTVATLTAEVCADVEVIGWLYQFYISDRKDEVIGKVVQFEDIPAATQLFTPNWIVKYMVQNSLGAQWLATYPDSPLKGQMEYYIEPAEQTDEVNAQLAAITPSQLNPEELTLIDPASGSGHILVEAYELFKAIYLERGYQQRDVPQLILEKNLYGLDIDERAAQLTSFALIMKARADDRRLFERGVQLNVMALVNSTGFNAEALAKGVELSDYRLKPGDLTELKQLFEHATTFGSLIQVPEDLAKKLPALKQLSETTSQDLFVSEAIKRLGPLVQQAELLAAQYDAVVANPPYMGSKYHVPVLKEFLKDQYADVKSDLFSAFSVRCSAMGLPDARVGLMSPNVWMYISSHEGLRHFISSRRTLASLVELPLSGFKGATVQICSFILRNSYQPNAKGSFIRLVDFKGGDSEMASFTKQAIDNPDCGWFFEAAQDEFRKIPGSPIAYWVSKSTFETFADVPRLEELAQPRKGMVTARNAIYLREWFEVDHHRVGFGHGERESAEASGCKWFPYIKGGQFRRWFGNRSEVVDWERDGLRLRTTRHPTEDRIWATNFNLEYCFRPNVNWSDVTSGRFSARYSDYGSLFDATGLSCFPDAEWQFRVLAFLNTTIVDGLLKLLNPTLHYQAGNIADLPFPPVGIEQFSDSAVLTLIGIATKDWNAYERSWDFQSLPLLTASTEPAPTLESSYAAWVTQNRGTIAEMKRLEEENNRLFIDAYGLADELTPDVPIEQITLTVNPAYRYGGKLTEEEQWTRFRQDTMQELVSYAVGCMMGRYSLDEPGLILANQGDGVAEYLAHVPEPSFSPDEDNVIPILGDEWFADDIVGRFREFLKTAFGEEHFEENLRFVEDGLGKPIRKYFVTDFYKDHVQAYKKRPIYWMFSSPKGSFNALIYLHRYQPDTVSVVLNKYLREFQAKLHARLDTLAATEISVSASTKEKTAARKEADQTRQIITELADYERDTLYPLATQQIDIDLDDGVKANYPKFGPALKKITGLST